MVVAFRLRHAVRQHHFVYFDFVAIFTFLMLAGRWLQLKVIERGNWVSRLVPKIARRM